MKYIVKDGKFMQLDDACKDASYIDVVKAVNRMMEAKSLEEDYLGCNVWMRDESRDQDKAVKSVHVDLGFSKQKNPDDFKSAITEALSQIYDSVKINSVETKDFPKRGQFEVNFDLSCDETLESESKLNEKIEEEAKQKEAERQAELKKRLAEEEAAAAQAKLEQAATQVVKQFALKLAKAKSINDLDAIFDEVEDAFERKEISENQFNKLTDVYNEAESRLNAGKTDNSFFLKLKYESQIDKAQTGSDVERIRKFIKKNFDEGQMDNATFEELNKRLGLRRNKLLKPGFDSVKDAVKYHEAIIEKQPDGYFMIKQLGTVYKTLEEAKKDVDEFAKIYDFKNDRPIKDAKCKDAKLTFKADVDVDEEDIKSNEEDMQKLGIKVDYKDKVWTLSGEKQNLMKVVKKFELSPEEYRLEDAMTLETAKSFLSFMDLDEDKENLIACTEDDDAYEKAQKWLDDNRIEYKHHASSDDEGHEDFEDDCIEFIIPKSQFSVKVLDIMPRKGESKSDFISRFMSETKSEYPDEKQRLAVAYSYWRKR